MRTGRPVKNPEAREKARTLLSMLPEEIVEELWREYRARTRQHDREVMEAS